MGKLVSAKRHWRIRRPGGDHHVARRAVLARRRRSGFTLIELLVVLLIILLVSAVALPTVLPAINHRQVSEAARILQAALVGARDKAIHDGQPSGIRLLPDPAFPLGWTTTGTTAGTVYPSSPRAYTRIAPMDPAPEYSEGMVTVRPGASYSFPTHHPRGLDVGLPTSQGTTVPVPTLVLEEAFLGKDGPNPPTSWFW